MNAFFDVLQERFLDINPYCRSKTIQVYTNKLLDLENKFPKRRQRVADLALRSLEDKSSNVRRNAIKLLTKLVTSHPYAALHGGTLNMKEWRMRFEVVDKELNALQPPPGSLESGAEPAVGNDSVDPALLDDATMMQDGEEGEAEEEDEDEDEEEEEEDEDGEPRPPKTPKRKKGKRPPQLPQPTPQQVQAVENSEEIQRLQLTRRYYAEAIRFIETIHDASALVCQLLSSKNKSEIIEAMDFFKVLDVHKVETAKVCLTRFHPIPPSELTSTSHQDGIRRMLRLIWTKGNSDEGKGIQSHLLEVYKDLFFDAPSTFSENETANYIARNMISLTFDTTAAELTCLEQLLSKMMKEGHVSDLVIHKLWQIYGVQKREISKSQRRGAIIVIGMLAVAEPEIVVRELETVLKIGLGRYGRADLGLARYTCAALRHISPSGRQAKDATTTMTKLPNDHAILVRLAALVELTSDSKEWFGVAEQAVSAIYALSKHPDVLCTEIIRRKTKEVFAGHQQTREASVAEEAEKGEDDMDVDMMDVDMDAPSPMPATQAPPQDEKMEEDGEKKKGGAFALSQLLFIVGHVAVKQIVHLEIVEMDFKRRKAETEKSEFFFQTSELMN